jgi:hypothetical protein
VIDHSEGLSLPVPFAVSKRPVVYSSSSVRLRAGSPQTSRKAGTDVGQPCEKIDTETPQYPCDGLASKENRALAYPYEAQAGCRCLMLQCLHLRILIACFCQFSLSSRSLVPHFAIFAICILNICIFSCAEVEKKAEPRPSAPARESDSESDR